MPFPRSDKDEVDTVRGNVPKPLDLLMNGDCESAENHALARSVFQQVYGLIEADRAGKLGDAADRLLPALHRLFRLRRVEKATFDRTIGSAGAAGAGQVRLWLSAGSSGFECGRGHPVAVSLSSVRRARPASLVSIFSMEETYPVECVSRCDECGGRREFYLSFDVTLLGEERESESGGPRKPRVCLSDPLHWSLFGRGQEVRENVRYAVKSRYEDIIRPVGEDKPAV